MRRRLYLLIRDLHLYLGLFASPFVLVFAISVFFLVHAWVLPAGAPSVRSFSNLRFPREIESLAGRERVEAVQSVLKTVGVHGEVGFIAHVPREHRLIVPVTVPGREATVEIDVMAGTASVSERVTGIGDAMIYLHKSPGPHLANIRMNWLPIRIWAWLSDLSVWSVLFLTVSGIWMWLALRAERRAGSACLAAGILTFCGVVYALVH